jgi:hypothetical protein
VKPREKFLSAFSSIDFLILKSRLWYSEGGGILKKINLPLLMVELCIHDGKNMFFLFLFLFPSSAIRELSSCGQMMRNRSPREPDITGEITERAKYGKVNCWAYLHLQ